MGTTYLVPMICSFPMIFNIWNSLSEFRILNFMEVIFDIWGFFFNKPMRFFYFFLHRAMFFLQIIKKTDKEIDTPFLKIFYSLS